MFIWSKEETHRADSDHENGLFGVPDGPLLPSLQDSDMISPAT